MGTADCRCTLICIRNWNVCQGFGKDDEKRFSVVYSDKASRQNTPVNVIVGALIIKELFDYSDDEMVESNIRKLSRMELIYTCIAKLAISVNKINASALPDDLKHYIDPDDFNRVIYHQRSTDACQNRLLLEMKSADSVQKKTAE